MLTKLPDGSSRKVGYADSGWTTYERCSAEQIKKFDLYFAQWKLVLDLGVASEQQQQRGWPVGPDDFDALVEGKKFTNGSDLGAVKALYRKMSVGQLGSIQELAFSGMPPPSVEDGRRLGGCLALCGRLEELYLERTRMGDEACAAVFTSLGEGALPSVKYISLTGNPELRDAGLSALAATVERGAMPSLKTLLVDNKQHPALKAACEARGIDLR